MDTAFSFGAEIVKAEQTQEGDWIFEGIASLPGQDLQGEDVMPQGLEIDYLLGKGLPPGAGGYVNYDHDATQIVGVPMDGKINSNGFWLKWKALKTPFMAKVVEQMKAMKEAGWPRRYGMSIEGVVKERDANDPSKIKRAFIRNVALTPTPVHPGTFVDFAKSLSAGASVEYAPIDQRRSAIAGWVETVADARLRKAIGGRNPYFRPDGAFRRDADLSYFRDVHGLPEQQVLWCARYALTRQNALHKALDARVERLHQTGPRGDPVSIVREHLREHKQNHPDCPHVTADGRIKGGRRMAAAHFLGCEHRSGPEVNAILEVLRGSGLLTKEEST